MQDTTGEQLQLLDTGVQEAKAADALTDAALAQAGMKKVTAFVRAQPSPGAKRKQSSRERLEERGLKQLNLQLPHETHAVFKDLAQELQRTQDITVALQSILDRLKAPGARQPSKKLDGLKRSWNKLLALLHL